jgi:hypothetical protein
MLTIRRVGAKAGLAGPRMVLPTIYLIVKVEYPALGARKPNTKYYNENFALNLRLAAQAHTLKGRDPARFQGEIVAMPIRSSISPEAFEPRRSQP